MFQWKWGQEMINENICSYYSCAVVYYSHIAFCIYICPHHHVCIFSLSISIFVERLQRRYRIYSICIKKLATLYPSSCDYTLCELPLGLHLHYTSHRLPFLCFTSIYLLPPSFCLTHTHTVQYLPTHQPTYLAFHFYLRPPWNKTEHHLWWIWLLSVRHRAPVVVLHQDYKATHYIFSLTPLMNFEIGTLKRVRAWGKTRGGHHLINTLWLSWEELSVATLTNADSTTLLPLTTTAAMPFLLPQYHFFHLHYP